MQVKSIAECSKGHSAILLTFIKLPIVIKIFIMSIFEWQFYTGFTVTELTTKDNIYYYIPINDTYFELSVFWLSDTEKQINKLRFSDSISLSFKTRLKSVSCFCGDTT